MDNMQEIKRTYYYTDIEPKFENLNEIIRICETFEKEGGDRLMCAMDMRRWDLDEIERLAEYIVQSRQKMETELNRLRKYKDEFNDMFATDHNNYYNSVAELLRHIRSHTSPLKMLLKKTCNLRHPNQKVCQRHGIKPKSVRKESVLAAPQYQKPLFKIDDPTIPSQVRGLFHELEKFFSDEKECMEICVQVLNDEASIRKDPVKSKYVLDKYRRKAFEKLRSQILLISDDTINMLKGITPAYQCDNPAWVKRIKYVIKHFDELLPSYFTHKMMGKFQYYFCKWALPGNISNATKYFIKHYNGKWKVSKYAAVNSHSKDYDQHSTEVKDFHVAIETLLKSANMPEMTVQNA